MLVVLCTVLCTLMINVGFFQSKHNQLELCEGESDGDGRPTNCTGDVSEQALCYCQTFDCGVKGCDACARCDTIDNCAISCPAIQNSRIFQTFLTVLITWPIGSLLAWLFEWLHRPYVRMVEKELLLASEADALARVKRGVKMDGRRRYGRASYTHTIAGNTSDVHGLDEGSMLWTESEAGQEAIEEERTQRAAEPWEKEPILPDGRLPCTECGETPMRPRKIIEKVDYAQLESRLRQFHRTLSVEDIKKIYEKDELCAILFKHQMAYSYKKRGIDLQQSVDVMAWQVQRMVTAKVTEGATCKVFKRTAGTTWEHAMESLHVASPGHSVLTRSTSHHRSAKKHQSVCPACKGTGASGKVWYVTAPVRKAGQFRPSEYMKVTPNQRRLALKSLKVARSKERGRRFKGGRDEDDRPPPLDDKADRAHLPCGHYDAALPYTLGLLVGLFCVIQIARIVRNFSASRTIEWLASSVVSLVLSWTLTDPLKIVVITPFLAYRKHRKLDQRARNKSRAHAKLQGVMFLLKSGVGAPMGLRQAGRNVIQLNNALGTRQRRLLKAAVRKQEEQIQRDLEKTQAAEVAQLEKQLKSEPEDLRVAHKMELKRKHDAERLALNGQMNRMDEDLQLVLSDQHEKFKQMDAGPLPQRQPRNDPVASPTAIQNAQGLMSTYDSEAAKLQQKMDDDEAVRAKIEEKRRQMAERVASVERLLHVHSKAAEHAIADVKEQQMQDAVAAQKKELEEATAKMEHVLWKNRHAIETEQAVTAVNACSSGTGLSSNVSLAADIRSIRAGIPARTTLAHPEDLKREMEQALEPEQVSVKESWAQRHDVVRHGTEGDTALQIATSDAKARWNHALEWQKRVAALIAPTASGDDKLASVVQSVRQLRIEEGTLTRPRPLPRQPTTRGERSVSFSSNTITAQTRTSTHLLATRRPHAPARVHDTVDGTGPKAGRTTHKRVATMLRGAEVTSDDEARIHAKIDRAKRALEAKKKMQAAKVLGSLSRSSKSP